MKSTIRIAAHELRGLFYSPIAWLVLVAFIVPSGLAFASVLGVFQREQYLGDPLSGLTREVFSNPYLGLFVHEQNYLYLFIPLLTMGLMSRELGTGSVKLLYSSPITLRQIVFGKFLAMAGFSLVFLGILAALMAAATVAIEAIDLPFVLSGLLGLYLLMCAYSAIGLFVSCLTSYQVVAAISTLIVLATLDYIGNIGRQYDFVRDLTYFLSISGRTRDFIGGLINTKDAAYFLIVTAMFLLFSVIALRSAREGRQPIRQLIRYASVISGALLLGYLTSRPALWTSWDLSENKEKTITKTSQEILTRMPGPISITTYGNLLDQFAGMVLPNNRNEDLKAFDKYLRFKHNLQMSYVYYYDKADNPNLHRYNPGLTDLQLAEREAAAYDLNLEYFLSPKEIHKLIDLAPEENRITRLIEYQGKKTFLRTFHDVVAMPEEAEITAALKRLVVPAPKMAFLTGHGERRLDRSADSDYDTATRKLNYRYALINQGFDVEIISLEDKPIPADVTALVIADPKQPLGEALPKIRDFIAAGGSVLIAAEPGDESDLNSLLESVGVRLSGEVLRQTVDPSQSPTFLFGRLVSGNGIFDDRTRVRLDVPGYGQSIFDVKRVSMPTSVGIDYQARDGVSARPILVADAENHPDVPVAVGVTRSVNGKIQRILVVGDADFMSNQELSRSNLRAANLSFVLESFKWLGGGQFPVDTNHPKPKDNSIRVDHQQIFYLQTLFAIVIPVLVALGGAVLLLRRRRL